MGGQSSKLGGRAVDSLKHGLEHTKAGLKSIVDKGGKLGKQVKDSSLDVGGRILDKGKSVTSKVSSKPMTPGIDEAKSGMKSVTDQSNKLGDVVDSGVDQ